MISSLQSVNIRHSLTSTKSFQGSSDFRNRKNASMQT
nr:MAG TPA: hypothetical protein [Caudoviricetes sp.]